MQEQLTMKNEPDESGLLYEKKSRNGEEYLEVKGISLSRKEIVIPAQKDGIPVRVIGNHAFASDKVLEYVTIPSSVDTILGFAFHYCASLKKITLTDSIEEYLDGSTRQCRALGEIDVTLQKGNPSIIQEILEDNDKQLVFQIHMPDGEARLLFPAYVYDFTENTMARTIQFSIEGSGYAYRECVHRDTISFHDYDKVFERAKGDDPVVASDIALERLRYPYALADRCKEVYANWILEMAQPLLLRRIEAEDAAAVRFLTEQDLLTQEAADAGIDLASRKKKTEICGILMEYRKNKMPQGGTDLSLDDLDF